MGTLLLAVLYIQYISSMIKCLLCKEYSGFRILTRDRNAYLFEQVLPILLNRVKADRKQKARGVATNLHFCLP